MDYPVEIRKFISSQYLYAGMRITAGVVIPALILYHYGLLASMFSIPLGALFVSLTDNPGPIKYRRNAMIISILVNAFVVLITSYLKSSPIFISIGIVVFGMIFSLISVYGNRANVIGLIALVAFILNIDQTLSEDPWMHSLQVVVGGAWYALLSLTLYTLRPFKPIQQALGESLMEIADYLRAKALFYQKERDESRIYHELMQKQVKIHQHQDALREMLFTTRRFISDSTSKGRVLMMIFLESIDLMERIMTSQQDYDQLHKESDESGVLDHLGNNIVILANELHNTGLAVQSGYAYKSASDLDNVLKHSLDEFIKHRDAHMNANNVESFIRLRQIIYSLQDITERIKRLETYTSFDKKIAKEFNTDIKLEKFVPSKELDPQLFISNLTLKSANFRHALRLTIALLAGYIVSLLYPIGHGYWILLTIATIIKPAYSITRSRNIQRLIGTLIGTAIGFAVLSFVQNNTALFLIMLVCMVISYSLLKIQFLLSTAGLTSFIIISFHFLNPSGLQDVLTDRIIDTFIGSALAFLASRFILPDWEHEVIDDMVKESVVANREYFKKVSAVFFGKSLDVTTYKIARKDAFVALANLSDHFQKMLSEPRSRQPHLEEYHQFVAASHMLTSHNASLSYYAERFGEKYALEDFRPMILEINKRFDELLDTINGKGSSVNTEEIQLPISQRVLELMEQRKKDLEEGVESDMESLRRTLSNLKTLADQFQLIHGTLIDLIRVIRKIKGT